MTTPRQKRFAFNITRIIVFILGTLAITLHSPWGDVLGVVSLFIWLWMPNLVQLELKLWERFHR